MSTEVSLQVAGVTVDFPVYTADTRSLKNDLLRKSMGGRIGRDARNGIAVRALCDVNLALRHGDRIGLIGANGAGKTTLLRLLAGVYPPTIGRVQRRGRVASLFDISLGLDPDATGYENIMMRGLLLGLRPAQVRERSAEIAAFTGLGDYLSMPIQAYSAGMLLRLAFAVSTCVQPEILLMDEWIGVGDAAFVEKAERRLESLVSRAGILVLASHNLALLERVCATGIFLDAGRVRAIGPIGEVLRKYEQSAGGHTTRQVTETPGEGHEGP